MDSRMVKQEGVMLKSNNNFSLVRLFAYIMREYPKAQNKTTLNGCHRWFLATF